MLERQGQRNGNAQSRQACSWGRAHTPCQFLSQFQRRAEPTGYRSTNSYSQHKQYNSSSMPRGGLRTLTPNFLRRNDAHSLPQAGSLSVPPTQPRHYNSWTMPRRGFGRDTCTAPPMPVQSLSGESKRASFGDCSNTTRYPLQHQHSRGVWRSQRGNTRSERKHFRAPPIQDGGMGARRF